MEFNLNTSTSVSKLSKSELSEYLLEVNMSEFIFRNKLVLDSSITYGNEIEVNGIDKEKAEEIVYTFNMQRGLSDRRKFELHDEMTADCEIVTPIMFNSTKNWDYFYDIYKELCFYGASVGENTASHVHLGAQHLNTPKLLSTFLKMLVVFEPIIFKFGYGFDDKPRDYIRCSFTNSNYAMMSSPKRYSKFISGLRKYKTDNPSFEYEKFKDFLALDLEFRPNYNFKDFDFDKISYGLDITGPKEYDHMEVRCFNGTLDPVIGQNNINLITHILEAVIMERIDMKYLNAEYDKYRRKRYDFDVWRAIVMEEREVIRYNRLLDGFSKVKLDKALKLADMIFVNEIDKVYFLKQYLKLFEIPKSQVLKLVNK